MPRGFSDNRRKQHKQRRKDKQDDEHGNNRAAADEQAQAADQVDFGDKRQADSRGKEGQAACDDARRTGLHRNCRRFARGKAVVALLTVARRHQDRIIHCRAELDCAEDNARDKRDRRTGEIRDAEVYHNCAFNGSDQQHRNGNRFECQQDDGEHCENRGDRGRAEVVVTDGNQILCHRALTRDDAVFIIALDNLVDGIYLCVHLIASRLVFRRNHHQTVPARMEQRRHILRHNTLRDAAADILFIAQRILDAVHAVNLIRKALHIR